MNFSFAPLLPPPLGLLRKARQVLEDFVLNLLDHLVPRTLKQINKNWANYCTASPSWTLKQCDIIKEKTILLSA